MAKKIEVSVEKAQKRAFADAIDWPGWCRSGRTQEAALQALLDYAPRYSSAIQEANARFKVPKNISEFQVVEVLKGNPTTDFGAPGVAPSADANSITDGELEKLIGLLDECWNTFDRIGNLEVGKKLATGPRGGGRDLAKIRLHVLEGGVSYLSAVGGRFKGETKNIDSEMKRMRKVFTEALFARARGELPDVGPRGGKRITARYAVRRAAWHVLDHAWEIEDRVGL